MDERQLQQVFEQCDVGWMFAQGAVERARQVLREMHEVDRVFFERFNRPLDPPVADAILADVTRFKALVQTFASPMTAPIRAMAYCLLDGAQLKAVRFDYRFKARAHLEIEIEYDPGEPVTFSSDDLWDAEALRHLGLVKRARHP
jgi:hypothetical protein